MSIKKTHPLKVAPSQHIAQNTLSMHPNDGFDLGLFTKSHQVQWSVDIGTKEFIEGGAGTTIEACLNLLNECPGDTLQMNMKQWEKINKPERAICLLDGQRFIINKLPSEPKDDE